MLMRKPYLNNFLLTHTSEKFYGNPSTTFFLKVGKLFSELINEKLNITASSPLDYLKPENWVNQD
jgi:hypothetical protein